MKTDHFEMLHNIGEIINDTKPVSIKNGLNNFFSIGTNDLIQFLLR